MKKALYGIIFLVSMATLIFETVLTRIFSVTMWYHYAFMAISIAMLGMSSGAVKVFVSSFKKLEENLLLEKIQKNIFYFAVSIIFSLLTIISIPFVPRLTALGIYSVAFIYFVASIPFFFSGVVISAILTTKYLKQVNKLYAYDLAGASIGALSFFFLMNVLDAISVVFFVSAIAFFASWLLKKEKKTLVISIFIFLFVFLNNSFSIFKIEWSKASNGQLSANVVTDIEWEKWTPFSRITVHPFSDRAFGWGISAKMMKALKNYKVHQKTLVIDSAAATVITKNDFPIMFLHHLTYDITNLAHFVVDNGKIAVIGVGGGRDILSALQFKQKEVWGIEINKRILEAITKQYANYTYPFKSFKNVHLVNDEARSFIERTPQKFDMIQASLIDSWAATTAGAFVLTENSLYTVEAWDIFLKKLTKKGVITMSRWYYKKRPGELLRLTNLAVQALKNYGIKNPKKHILLASTTFSGTGLGLPADFGTGTIIVSKREFPKKMIDRFLSTCDRFGFTVLLSAGAKKERNEFALLLDSKLRKRFVDSYPLNITPPTDNSPFFFNMLKPLSILTYHNISSQGPLSTNLKAVSNLIILFFIVLFLSILMIIYPLWKHFGNMNAKSFLNAPVFYFFSIGTGFMLIEISLIQKFTVFLGHPSYSLVVVLFTILLFTGIGSFISGFLRKKLNKITLFALIILTISIVGGINMFLLPEFSSNSLAIRILYSFITMALAGTVLGIPFPTGMSSLNKQNEEKAAWFWGINGASSVISSVLAVMLSLFVGISTTFFVGIIFYIFAGTAFFFMKKSNESN